MAERRMFAKTIIDSDAFLDMPLSSQALYFHLSMRADDDGFINNPKKIQRMIGASDDDGKMLIAKRFIIPFESGIVVIKHWKIHNYIRGDRKKETVYPEEMSLLTEKDNGAYSLRTEEPVLTEENVYAGQLSATCPSSDSQVTVKCQHRLGKDSIGKDSIGKDNDSAESAPAKKPVRQKYGEYNNVLLTDEEMEKLISEFPVDYSERIERLSGYIASTGKRYKNHLATIRNWARKEPPQQQKPLGSFDTSEFFESAVMKGWDNKKPPKTAEDSPELLARAEELRKQLSGVGR